MELFDFMVQIHDRQLWYRSILKGKFTVGSFRKLITHAILFELKGKFTVDSKHKSHLLYRIILKGKTIVPKLNTVRAKRANSL